MYLSMAKVVLSLIIEVALFAVAFGDDRNVYLIYAAPGGVRGGRALAGLFGGNFNPGVSPSNLDLEQVGIYSSKFGSEYPTYNLWVQSLSYDPESKKVLMQIGNSARNSLAKIDPCNTKEELGTEDAIYYEAVTVQTGPFALYDSDIYFVARTFHVIDRNISVTLSIRKLTGCQASGKGGFTNNEGSDNRNCSVEVATVAEEVIYSSERELTPDDIRRNTGVKIRIVGSSLRVVKHEDKLHFLVQIADPLNHGPTVYGVRPDNYSLRLYDVIEGGLGRVLYVTPVNTRWAIYSFSNFADIAYKDGLLCWSAFDSAFCGNWNIVGDVSGVTEIIKPGDVAPVFKGTSSRLKMNENFVTGIVITSTKDKIGIVFGCWMKLSGIGGAGYLTANSDWSDIKIKPLADKKGPVLAGSFAITDGCPDSSRREVGLDAFL